MKTSDGTWQNRSKGLEFFVLICITGLDALNDTKPELRLSYGGLRKYHEYNGSRDDKDYGFQYDGMVMNETIKSFLVRFPYKNKDEWGGVWISPKNKVKYN